MSKKIAVFLVICVMMVSVAGCGSESGSQQPVVTEAQEGDESKDVNVGGEDVFAEGTISKGRSYRLKRADNDSLSIELLYRGGSDKVAEISGEIVAPAGTTEYDGMVADNAAFADKVAALNLPDDMMSFGYDEVKLENGYVRCHFVFSELDAENASSVEMIAEFLGLPATNETFSLSECDAYLQGEGVTLESEW